MLNAIEQTDNSKDIDMEELVSLIAKMPERYQWSIQGYVSALAAKTADQAAITRAG